MLFDIAEDISGLEVSRGSRVAGSRRIVCLDTASCFADITQVLPKHFQSPPATTEDLNTGIHGQIYTGPNDFLVVQANYWAASDLHQLADHLLDLNARIWEFQTGMPLLRGGSGGVSFVRPGESMLEAAINLFEQDQNATFVASNLTPRLVRLLHAENTTLKDIAESCDLLNHKNCSMELLKTNGIRVPKTLAFNQSQTNDKRWRVDLDDLPPDLLYVLKADGSSGGIGVYTNQNRGYDLRSLRMFVARLMDEDRLPGRFQIQEFVNGKPMGALAVFGKDGAFNIVTIHEQKMENGRFVSAHWKRAVQDEFTSQVREVYARLSSTDGLCPRGPIGIDFVVCGSEIRVVEVNARLTGSGPIAWLLAKTAKDLEVECIDLLEDIALPLSVLRGQQVYSTIRSIASDQSIRSRCGGKPMILPEGLDPFRPNKVLFVNDREGVLKSKWREEFPSCS